MTQLNLKNRETNLVHKTHTEYEVIVLAPSGLDAASAVGVLSEGGLEAVSVAGLPELISRLNDPIGAVLIAEEALSKEHLDDLKQVLEKQEGWSNIPFILMTSQTERLFSEEMIMDVFGLNGSVYILERPFKIFTLITTVKVALKMRAWQYQVRELLHQQMVAVQQRDEFLSIASHELKTPITSMKIQVQSRKRMIKKGDASAFSPEKVVSLLESSETQMNRLTHLIDNMLDISKLVNGKLSLIFEPVDMSQLVTDVFENLSDEFRLANCEVNLQLKEGVMVVCDRYRIEQVLTNLFSNALKYGRGRPVSFILESDDEKLLFSVKDQGVGIANENLERIFDRFERAVSGTVIGGLGLGLYITRQILEMHNGQIYVESIVGKGSTFAIELPLNGVYEN